MMKINQINYHIKNCYQFQKTNYLLVAKYNFFSVGIEEKNYVYNSTTNSLIELEGDLKEIIYSTNDYFIYALFSTNNDEIIYKMSNNNKEIVGQRYCRIDGENIYILTNNQIVKYDNNLNVISKLDDCNESFFRIEDEVEYWNDDYPYQKYNILKCKASTTNLIYKDKSNSKIFIHDFTNMNNIKIYTPMLISKETIIDAICFNNKCYILTGKNNKFEVKIFSEASSLIDSISIDGKDPFFKTTSENLMVIYDDYKNWTKEQKKAYPEFETGNSNFIFLA